MSFKNRVIERRKMRVGDLAENPRNPKTHPVEQRKRMRAILDELGIVTELVAYYRDDVLTLFDGHLRSQLDPDQEWDIAITDLSVQEVDRLVLFYDPLAGLAERDEERWQAIVDGYDERNQELAGWLEEMRGEDIIIEPPDDFAEYSEDIETQYECPKCGYEWSGSPD